MPRANPIIRHKFTADPTALVFKDNVYLYTGHDEPPPGIDDYYMHEWLCFSSKDLTEWQEHPSPLKATDFKWAKGDAYASKVVFHNNKFFWFVSVSHATIPGKAIGVAASDNPTGPFIDAIGSALITQDMIPDTDVELVNLDPTVLIDEINQAHLIWGNTKCYYTKLSADLLQMDGPIRTLSLPSFTEGSNLHTHNGWYYLSYGYGFPEKVAYAMSRSPEGPWEYKGILNEIPANCQTNRPAVIDFKGKSWFFCHNGALLNGGSHRRSVCLAELHYNPDGTIKPIVMVQRPLRKRYFGPSISLTPKPPQPPAP